MLFFKEGVVFLDVFWWGGIHVIYQHALQRSINICVHSKGCRNESLPAQLWKLFGIIGIAIVAVLCSAITSCRTGVKSYWNCWAWGGRLVKLVEPHVLRLLVLCSGRWFNSTVAHLLRVIPSLSPPKSNIIFKKRNCWAWWFDNVFSYAVGPGSMGAAAARSNFSFSSIISLFTFFPPIITIIFLIFFFYLLSL